ncbi:trigger factor [Fodinicola feengrottensis]|uniref:Trigger factor n=1 Tax=Fodinicola feengrottensis TaxID=435914 RepID=A0ABN2I7P7_9ACTN|nr:trigger factor [Fodinicola feengrottensis]
MKSTVETLSPTRVKLSVEVPFEELQPSLDKAYKQIAQQVAIPGFRRGKVPARLIDQRVGRASVLSEAINDAIPVQYSAAIQEHDVKVLGQPDIDVTKLEDGDELSFTAEVDVRPEITLPVFDELKVTVDTLDVTDADVDEHIDLLRDRFAVLKNVERAAAEKDYVSIDLVAKIGGEEVEGGSTSGLSYEVGTNQMLDGLDEAIIGLTVDQDKTFSTKLVGGDHAGEEAEVTVTVKGVKEKDLPALDDDFAQTASEFDTIDELRTDARTRVERNKRLEQIVAARDGVLKALIEAVEVPLPESVVLSELDYRKQAISRQLEQAGATIAQYLAAESKTEEDLDAELKEASQDAVRNQLVLDAVADSEELGVTNEELTTEVVQRSAQIGREPQQYADELVNSGQLPFMIADIRRGKALALVLDKATIEDSAGTKIDLGAAMREADADAHAGHDHADHDHGDHDHADHDHADHDHGDHEDDDTDEA